ncbi:MAG TPA: inositol monophosphatase family protein [Acidimicrobiia bacterium]
MTPDDVLALFDVAAAAQRGALATLGRHERRARTDRPSQYRLDLVADAAVLPVLHAAGMRVLSEESGWTGPADAELTVVLDPVDGSTNCARGIPYWAISLCALDADGPWCALVQNGATGARYSAVRGEGASLDRATIAPAATTEIERAVVALSGLPPVPLAWRQFRALGSAALALCDVAAGHLDGYLDGHPDQHAPWDYLGALLVCREAGALVTDAHGRDLVALDASARRQLLAAGTNELLTQLHGGIAQ